METNKPEAWDRGQHALAGAKAYVLPPPPTDALLLAVAYENNEYAEESVWAIYKQGERFVVYIAQCDTTGWDCQAGSSLETYDTIGNAVAAIDDRARPHLAWAHEVQR